MLLKARLIFGGVPIGVVDADSLAEKAVIG